MTGCAQKCEDFDKSIVEWMPYKEADKIVFLRNNKADTKEQRLLKYSHKSFYEKTNLTFFYCLP
jgi:hypothetical protein